MNFDSVLELEVKVLSQEIILEAVTKCVDDVLIEKIAVCSNKIEFIFEEDFQSSI
jgi:hypothetical protein